MVSSVVSTRVPRGSTPAVLTTKSMEPCSANTCSAALRTSSRRCTWVWVVERLKVATCAPYVAARPGGLAGGAGDGAARGAERRGEGGGVGSDAVASADLGHRLAGPGLPEGVLAPGGPAVVVGQLAEPVGDVDVDGLGALHGAS